MNKASADAAKGQGLALARGGAGGVCVALDACSQLARALENLARPDAGAHTRGDDWCTFSTDR